MLLLPAPPAVRLFERSIRSKSAVLLRNTADPMLEKLADGFGSLPPPPVSATAAAVGGAVAGAADGFSVARIAFFVRPNVLSNELPLLLFSTGGGWTRSADADADRGIVCGGGAVGAVGAAVGAAAAAGAVAARTPAAPSDRVATVRVDGGGGAGGVEPLLESPPVGLLPDADVDTGRTRICSRVPRFRLPERPARGQRGTSSNGGRVSLVGMFGGVFLLLVGSGDWEPGVIIIYLL